MKSYQHIFHSYGRVEVSVRNILLPPHKYTDWNYWDPIRDMLPHLISIRQNRSYDIL